MDGRESEVGLPSSQCNKGQARAQNFFSPISINLVPKVASNCGIMKIHRVARLDRALSGPPVHCKSVKNAEKWVIFCLKCL